MTKVEFTKKETAEARAIANRHPDFDGITTPVLHDIFMKALRAYDIRYDGSLDIDIEQEKRRLNLK